MGIFSKFGGSKGSSEEYVEIDVNIEEKKKKIQIKPFILKTFDDVNAILAMLREGSAIIIVDIKPMKSKDIIELRRAISKIKKTAEALEGDIAGFGENIVIITPQFAEIKKDDMPIGNPAPSKQERERPF